MIDYNKGAYGPFIPIKTGVTKMQQEVLIPTYMKSFTCIGSTCEDSCCIGWRVTLDKRSYKNYKNLKHPVLSDKLKDSMKRIKNETTSESNYAHFVMDKQNRCPMLEESGLCGIQGTLGEHMLSPTCTTYPRAINMVGKIVEISAKLSCPEVARLALLNPDGIEFEHMESEVNPAWGMRQRVAPFSLENGEDLFGYLRAFSIEIIQKRNINLIDRMIFLGLFINKLQVLLDEQNYDNVEVLVNEYKSKINDPLFVRSLSSIQPSLELQLRLVTELIQKRNISGGEIPRYTECYSDMLMGYDILNNETFDLNDLKQKYQYNFKEFYTEFYKDYGYILENYLVNYMFENLFPNCLNGEKVFEQYIRMAVLYAMLRIHLVGVSGAYKGLNTDMALKVIQSYTRVVEHNVSYLNSINELLQTNGLNSLAHIVAMLKE